jgi:hypothetical protein
LAFFIAGVYRAEANIDQVKIYKKSFPEAKPKCFFCHLDKIPKKDAGMHDMSAYGTKVKETAGEITEETYTKVGAFEDFKEGEDVPVAVDTEVMPSSDDSEDGATVKELKEE